MAEVETQLFDACLVIELEEVTVNSKPGKRPPVKGKKALKPIMKYSFPPTLILDEMLQKSVPQFCFPDTHIFNMDSDGERRTGETFSFILTDVDGNRRYGYCRRIQYKSSAYPIAFCILSSYPSFDLFFQILDIVEQRMKSGGKKSSVSVFSFLKAVLAERMPQPGETVDIKFFSTSSDETVSEAKLIRKNDSGDSLLDYVSFKKMFCGDHALAPHNFVAVILSLLLERRVMIISSSISCVSDTVLALTAAIYPFSWQMVMIPVLPHELISYITAPMPFIIGIMSQYQEEVNRMPTDEMVKVDMDANEVYLIPEDAPFLGEKSISKLRKDLEDVTKMAAEHSTKWFEGEVVDILLEFFISLLDGCDKYFKKKSYDSKGFLKNHKKNTKKLLDAMMTTQSFQIFLDERRKLLDKKSEISGRFNEALKDPEYLTRERNERKADDGSGIVVLSKENKGQSRALRIPSAFLDTDKPKEVVKSPPREENIFLAKHKRSETISGRVENIEKGIGLGADSIGYGRKASADVPDTSKGKKKAKESKKTKKEKLKALTKSDSNFADIPHGSVAKRKKELNRLTTATK